jgi:oligosaccharide repeat unit polymerase
MVGKRNTALIKYAPIMVILAAWFPQLAYRQLVAEKPFAVVDASVASLIIFAIGSYIIGAMVGKTVNRKYLWLSLVDPKQPELQVVPIGTTTVYRKFRLVLIFLALAFFFKTFALQIISGVDMAALRDEALSDWNEGGVLVKLAAVGANGLACSLLLCISLQYRMTQRVDVFLVVLFLCVCIAAYARTLLLIGVFILLIRLIANHKSPVILASKLLLGFVFLFLLLAVFGKSHSDANAGALDLLIKHAEVYFFGGVAGLNTFASTGEPFYNSTLSVPRFLHGFLSIKGDLPPQYFDFVETPVPLNVYTAIYPPLHDFGIIGVLFFFFIYGLVTATSCRKFVVTDSYVWQVTAGFLLYATAMSIFDDQFIRALPVFLIFVFFTLCFSLLQRKFEKVDRIY